MFLTGFSVVVFLVLLLVACLLCIRLNESELNRPTCGSFSSYADAKKAYDKGNKALDSNKDGIPCNYLYKKSLHA